MDGEGALCARGFCRCRQGQLDNDASALRLQVLQADLAFVLLDDAVADTQAEASSLPYRLSRIERIEGPVQVGKSGTAIFNFNIGTVTTAESPHHNAPRLNAGFDRINGIIQQVEEDLFELIFIDRNVWQIGFDVDDDTQIPGANVVLAQRQHVLDNRRKFHRLAIGGTLAGKA